MRNPDYIPRRDSAFDIWQNRLIAIVQTNLALWLIPLVIFDELIPFKTEWDASWMIGKDLERRSRSDVARKNEARRKYMAALRTFVAAYLAHNPLITNEYREKMALPIYDRKPTPPSVPTTLPFVEMQPASGHRFVVRYSQQGGEKGSSHPRAKPTHVSHMELIYKIGEPAPATADDCNKRADISRVPYYLDFNTTDAGKRLYWFARWVNIRHQPGPWTQMGSAIIP